MHRLKQSILRQIEWYIRLMDLKKEVADQDRSDESRREFAQSFSSVCQKMSLLFGKACTGLSNLSREITARHQLQALSIYLHFLLGAFTVAMDVVELVSAYSVHDVMPDLMMSGGLAGMDFDESVQCLTQLTHQTERRIVVRYLHRCIKMGILESIWSQMLAHSLATEYLGQSTRTEAEADSCRRQLRKLELLQRQLSQSLDGVIDRCGQGYVNQEAVYASIGEFAVIRTQLMAVQQQSCAFVRQFGSAASPAATAVVSDDDTAPADSPAAPPQS